MDYRLFLRKWVAIMKLREELSNRSKVKKDLRYRVEDFTNYEKEDLFTILKREADKGLTSCVIQDYVLAYPYLVNKNKFEDILKDENLAFEYIPGCSPGSIDCVVKWA